MNKERLESAITRTRETFPVPGYIKPDFFGHWRYMSALIAKHVPDGGRIMDFGSGPGDFAAVLAGQGYDVSAGDDLLDPWHLQPGVRDKLYKFMADSNVKFSLLEHDKPLPWPNGSFDLVMAHHVFEHIGESPKPLLEALCEQIHEGGHLLITVPSAVNIRKRLDMLRGKTNHPPYDQFYWMPSPWRGHRREYSRADLEQASQYLNLEVVELHAYTCMLHRVPAKLRWLYKQVVKVFPDWQDSWVLLARKPKNWRPLAAPPDAHTLKAQMR